jgi:hypothetical protein
VGPSTRTLHRAWADAQRWCFCVSCARLQVEPLVGLEQPLPEMPNAAHGVHGWVRTRNGELSLSRSTRCGGQAQMCASQRRSSSMTCSGRGSRRGTPPLVWRHVPGMETSARCCTEQSASSAGWARALQMGAPRRTEQLEELTSRAPRRRVSSRHVTRLRVLLRSGVAASASRIMPCTSCRSGWPASRRLPMSWTRRCEHRVLPSCGYAETLAHV